MANPSMVRKGIGAVISWFGRSLAAGTAYVLFALLGGAIAQALRLPSFSIGSPMDPAESLLILFVSGLLFGMILGPFAARLPLRVAGRAVILFITVFILNSLINTIEGIFFTTVPAAQWISPLVLSAVQAGGLASALALLFPPRLPGRGLLEVLRENIGRRRWWDWLMRLILAGLVYFPVYFVFGIIVSPIVVPYYQNPALGLQLTIPGFDLILPLEISRGLLYALTLFPLIVFLQADGVRSRWGIALWIILVQAALGSWQPMLNASFWPAALRWAHGLEITADCIVYGLLAVWLLAPGRRETDSVRKDDPVSA